MINAAAKKLFAVHLPKTDRFAYSFRFSFFKGEIASNKKKAIGVKKEFQ